MISGWRLGAIFGAIAIVLVAIKFVLFFNYTKVRDNQDWVAHTREVLGEIVEIKATLASIESSARGFRLTRNESLRRQVEDEQKHLWDRIARLQFLTKDNSAQQASSASLYEMIQSRIQVLNRNVDLSARGVPFDPATLLEGKQAMDRVVAQLDVLTKLENQLLAERNELSARSSEIVNQSFAMSLVINLLLVMFAYVFLNRHLQGQERALIAQTRLNWVQSSLVQLSQNLTGQTAHPLLASKVLICLTDIFKFPAANFYLWQKGRLKRVATHAGQPSTGKDTYELGESLVGAAALRREVYELADLPEGYFPVQSSLGGTEPDRVLFIPLHHNQDLIGVIEFSALKALKPEDHELLNLMQERIAIAINTSLTRERQQELLEETQRQSEELEVQTSSLQISQERLQHQQEELRQVNEELEAQARAMEQQQLELNDRNSKLERANEYKSQFLAKMSHELRTPLNSMLVLSSLLAENKDSNLTSEQKDFANTINHAGNDLLSLINDILDLSKLEAHKLILHPENFSVRGLCEQVEQQFKPFLDQKNLEFQVNIHHEVPDNILSDRQRLEQVLRNFMSNAIKFTDEGRVELAVTPASPGSIRFSVRDTGIGVPIDKREAIFQAFEQVDGSTSRRFGGTGLGLTISLELARLLQGKIEIESEEGTGSVFSIVIPEEAVAMASSVQVETLSSKHQIGLVLNQLGGSVIERMVLIVEDDLSFRKAIESAVRGHGFKAKSVASAEEGKAVLAKSQPAAILMDVRLAGTRDSGLLREIKEHAIWRSIPVHLVAANEFSTDSLSTEAIKGTVSKMEVALDRSLKQILIIEDDRRQVFAIETLLSAPGVKIDSVGTGSEALQLIGDKEYNCIIADLSLPDISGVKLIEAIRAKLGSRSAPVIIYTGRDLERVEEEQLRAFSESIIIKGAKSPERLLDEVNLFLHRVDSALPQTRKPTPADFKLRDKFFEGRTVLLVDDDLRNVFAMTSALESTGLKVVAARNGIEALEALRSRHTIDLVLMDIMMPKMDGYEAISEIRKMNEFETLPIVALTAKAMKGDYEKCISVGANDYLTKPVNLMNLMSVMKLWFTEQSTDA